jgi:basic amino acid/polyamine antiporter, APA family
MIAVMQSEAPRIAAAPSLRRVLHFWPLTLYGLGVIIGAGIYVAVGAVMARAQWTAPLSFVAAGIVAALCGLCYAELSSRFPEAAGAPTYLKRAFGSDALSIAAGYALALSVAIAAASIARGSAAYAQTIIPLPDWLLAGALVVLFTCVACLGVRESVGLAALITMCEIGGLLFVSASGLAVATAPADIWARLFPQDSAQLLGMMGGAFIAFFAFLGFETMVNLAEEVVDARRVLPRAILASVAVSTMLYVLVAVVTVLVVPFDTQASTPLLAVVVRHGEIAVFGFSIIAMLSVANGVLIHIVMLARLLYGMARNGWLAGAVGAVDERTHTPLRATILTGGFVLALTLAFNFEGLITAATLITLVVFVLVAAALWRLHLRESPPAGAFQAPRWAPPLALVLSLGLIAAQFLM